MENFTEDQLKHQDFVDNQIYDLVKRLNPSTSRMEHRNDRWYQRCNPALAYRSI